MAGPALASRTAAEMVALQLSTSMGPIAGIAPLVRQAEDVGFDAIWIGEVNEFDAMVAATLTATNTSSAAIGVLCNVYTRSPTNVAMALSSLATLAPGRIIGVLGASSPLLVETWNGIPYRRPADRVRDYLQFVRMSTSGARVGGTFGTFASSGFSLLRPAPVPPRVFVAAAMPRMMNLATTQADGVVLNWVAPSELDGLPELGHDRTRVWISIIVCPTSDRSMVDSLVRPLLAAYLSAPAYAGLQRALGRGPLLELMWERFNSGNRDGACEALPDSVIEDLVVWGSPEKCAEQLKSVEAIHGVHAIATVYLGPGADWSKVLGRLSPGRA